MRYICFIFCLLAIPGRVFAATITVSPGQSIQSAANTANSGDTVSVSAGTYNETVSVSRPGIIFQANGVVTMKGFYITGNDTTVSGFRINDVPGYGVDVRSNNSVIKNNTITKARNACIWVSGQNNLIENNECSNTIQPTTNGGDADCFRFFGSGHTFSGNYCHDIPTDGVLVRSAHTDCFQTWNWTSVGGVGHDILFEKNTCILPFRGPEFSAKIWQTAGGAYNLTMKNNVGVANMIALLIDTDTVSFFNNTFVGMSNTSDALHLWRAKVSLYNNIFAHQKQRVIELIGSNNTITASNNCYMDYGIMLPANPGDVRTTDALFVNESLRDYRLQSNSPCLGMGAESSGGGSVKPGLPAQAGDSNGDNKVDGVDYVVWLNHYNQNLSSPTNGDFNNSGKVDGVDYVVWLNNYGT